MNTEELLNTLYGWATDTGVKIVISLLVLLISFKLINWLGKKLIKSGEKKHADKTILNTSVYVMKIVLKCLIGVCIVGYLGIDTSGVTALITSLGVCAGLAVNGALANLAGGVLLIITRPFKVDDYIEAQGVSGTVREIKITHTNLVTPDNKVIHIPNGTLSNGNIINYSENDTRRVDLEFMISYSTDPSLAKRIVERVISSHPKVLSDPAPFIRVSSNESSGVKIIGRGWTKTGDYWDVYFDVLESVKSEFKKQEIEVPYNRIDVRVKND